MCLLRGLDGWHLSIVPHVPLINDPLVDAVLVVDAAMLAPAVHRRAMGSMKSNTRVMMRVLMGGLA